ncbi:MAG: cardiolipin synthase [Nevskiales bacterium]|nr:cardiolipin synthase [Nevskiales bacterium]
MNTDASFWSALLSLWAGVGLFAAGHALLNKSDPRSAWGWIAVCWLFPFAGPALYFLFGINRIQTRAHQLGFDRRRSALEIGTEHAEDARNSGAHAGIPESLGEVVRTADVLTRRPLLDGNRIGLLHNGEQTYPRMLDAIDSARHSIYLASYIFDVDDCGRRFAEALARAHARGVDVRVLIDGIGERYSPRRMSRLLRRMGVPVSIFNPLRLLPPALHLNLRNHRKLLLVDGRVGFTGGMNISRRHLAADPTRRTRVTDLHFEVSGPILGQLAEVFAEDWRYSTRALPPPPPEARDDADGSMTCRVIADGPNEDFDHLSLVLQAAISAARKRIRIMTPYFLPPTEVAGELRAAALRGVEVEIILPAKNNLPFVHWASRHQLWQLMRYGVSVFYQPPPFCHSKLFVVDDCYAQIGSANLDARSLRLNFELALETYDVAFAQNLAAHFEATRAVSTPLEPDVLLNRSLAARTRDAFFWLFSPYM